MLETLTAEEDLKAFSPFNLGRLLKTVFDPEPGEKVCILIDLEDPRDIKDFGFLKDDSLTIQRHAYEKFYLGLKNGVAAEFGFSGGEMFAYKRTGGSNLDLPEDCYDIEGNHLSLVEDVYKPYDLILCISTESATAPLTASAKVIGFRGATMHGMNDIILRSGLAVDYNEVSVQAEKLRLGMTQSDFAEIDFTVSGGTYTLKLILNEQEAQKSHGLCLGKKPDIANLPAGEVYFVPDGAEGQFPMLYDDGTIGIMNVSEGRIQAADLLEGNQTTIDAHNAKMTRDPVTGEIGELGFGTQVLPVSGRDIQDEKILGTVHVATGRSDHLGGHLTPDLFAESQNATHDDILFAPHKTPMVNVPEVRIHKNGETIVVIENFKPAAYLKAQLAD
jgi:aminopeptidase